MVSGIMSGVEIGGEQILLQPDETLVLYTDGVTEALNAEGAMFDEPKLLDCPTDGQPADETVSLVVDTVRRHAAGYAQSDDITVVAVRRVR